MNVGMISSRQFWAHVTWHGNKFSSYSNKNKSKYKKVRVLPINESTWLKTLDLVFHLLAVHKPFYISICISTLSTQHTAFHVSLWRRAYAQNVKLRVLYRQYTNRFIFLFVFQHYIRSTQLLQPYLITINAISSGDLFSCLRRCLKKDFTIYDGNDDGG